MWRRRQLLKWTSRCMPLLGPDLALWWAPTSARAFFVFDGSNFAQNLVTAIEAVDQTLRQIQQYRTQILQFQQMVRDGVADIVYTWDALESIYDQVTHLDEEFAKFVEDLEVWVQQIQTREYYRSSPCYSSDLKCYRGQWRKVLESYENWQLLTTESQKHTLEVVLGNLRAEGVVLKASKAELRDLQKTAEQADGHWKAIQAGNMLTAHLARHLMAIRTLMANHYNMIAAQWAVELERDTRLRAARSRFYTRIQVGKEEELVVWPER